MPVRLESRWAFFTIRGTLDVRSVADAQRSEVRLGDAAGGGASVSHLQPVEVVIMARDVDGMSINRTGERITVRVVSVDHQRKRIALSAKR